jgi:hypothetical protein
MDSLTRDARAVSLTTQNRRFIWRVPESEVDPERTQIISSSFPPFSLIQKNLSWNMLGFSEQFSWEIDYVSLA